MFKVMYRYKISHYWNQIGEFATLEEAKERAREYRAEKTDSRGAYGEIDILDSSLRYGWLHLNF